MALAARPGQAKIDDMLDLQEVPPTGQWARVAAATRRLRRDLGGDWRLKVLLSDTPEGAVVLRRLAAHLDHAGLRYDTSREPGGVQSVIVAPRPAPDLSLAA